MINRTEKYQLAIKNLMKSLQLTFSEAKQEILRQLHEEKVTHLEAAERILEEIQFIDGLEEP